MADNSVKFLTGSISDLQAKNTNGTPKVPIVPGRVYFAVDTDRNYGYIAYDVSASQRLVMSTRAELSDRVGHDLTLGDKSYNGSADVDILGSDLHRLSASNYLGITNTNITTSPGITTASVYIIAEKKNKTAVVGNLVIYNNKEYYWSGGARWKPVGTASFKLRQNPISSPSASSSTISFIDTISQDENGIITATKKTVRNATASQSGVVTTTEQTFGGLKIFNNGIKLGSNINMGDAGTPSSYPFVGNKITWTGGTDGAEIYYRLDSSDAGRLFLNMTDDTNALIALAYNGTAKSYINPSTPSFYPATSNTGSLGTSSNKWANIYATTIHGNLDGNASTATNATTATNLSAAGTWTWANGTTAGPTATLVLGGKTTNIGAVPSASTSQSGIVTTGAQSFVGVKTFTNKIVLKDGNQAGAQIGAAYITTASTTNGEVVLQNGHLRFGGSGWDYNQWAGLKYDHTNKKIVLGLADGSEFKANNAQSGGTFKLAGISTVDLNKTASIRNLAVGGGIYWNPYVESSSDGSDAASITVLSSGAAGGTELRIQQANDSTDIINLVSPSYIYFNSKQAFQINDSWLRVNPNGGFSSGTLFSRLLRADAELQARDIGLYNANQFRTGRWYNVATGTAGDGSNSGTMGAVYLELGNGTAQSAASGAGGGNAKGYLRLYGSSTAVGTLEFDNTYFRPSADIYFVNNSSSTSGWANGIRGQVGANDYWRVGGGATGSNSGYMEIATADDANEPIYVRQYSGVFNTLNTTLTLLDASHNTIIPNALTVGTTSSQAANYKFYVNGTSYFNGNTTHNGIDYFANGTTYYINNSADANLRRGIFSGTSNGDTAASSFFNTGALEIREAGRVGNGQTSFNYAPRIGFHWSGRIAGSLSFHNDGVFYFRKQNGTDRATIDANVNGNSSTATQFASNKTITLSGDVSGSASSKGGWSITTFIGAGKVTNAMLAGSIENGKLVNSKITLAGNDVSLGGSLSADTLRTSLGLSNALHFIGIATVAITDGSTTDPKISGYTTKTSGDVIIDKNSAYEYIWTGSKWERLGGDGSYKVVQSAVSSPSTNGTGISFIDTISQNANGVISATKKTVRDASTSQSGVVNTGSQTFAGRKTFNNSIVSNGAASYAPLVLKGGTSNFREGLRIVPTGGWSDILLGGSDVTEESGTSANSWFLGNNNGNFYITRNGSTSSTASYASVVNNYWQFYPKLGINGTNSGYNFYVNGTTLLHMDNISGASSELSPTLRIDGKLNIYDNVTGGGTSNSLLNILTNGSHEYGIVMKLHSYGSDSPAIRFSHSSDIGDLNKQVNTNWSVGMYYNTTNKFAITQDRGTSDWGTARLIMDPGGITNFYITNQWLNNSVIQIGRKDTAALTDRAVIGVTDGNLHLDPYGSHHTYLNYYNHGKTYFSGSTYYINENGSYYNGNAASATKLATARNITVGAKTNSFNGSANITFTPFESRLVRALYNTDSNLNAFADRGHALGMCSLGDNGSVDNPGGKTGWHHVINLTWSDTADNNGTTTNEWCTQIANACGSSDLYVRSRSGGSITNGTAWTAPWTKILTASNYSGTLDSRYVKKSGDTMTGNLTAPSVYTSNWFRSTGKTGWYSETYGGGLYMSDSTYIRNYGGKSTRLDNLCLGADNNSYRLYVNGTSYQTDVARFIKTGTAAIFGGTAINISSSIYSPTAGIQICAGSGSATSSTAIGFHNPNISSAVLEYKNFTSDYGTFRMLSDDSRYWLTIGGTNIQQSTAWSKGTTAIGPDGTNKAILGYLASSTNGVVYGAHNSDFNTWAPVNLSGSTINFREGETVRGKILDGCLSLFPSNSNYREGIRIHAAGSWSDILLCGNDNTRDSGTSANSWFLGNNNGNFYITRNGSGTSTSSYLASISNNWTIYGGSVLYNSNDATLQMYTATNTTYGNESIAIQTCFDGQIPSTSDYTSSYEGRCNLLLQPRGGQVYIGTNLSTVGNTNYSLYVTGSQYIQTSSANSANNGLIINNGLLSIVNYGNTLTIGSSNSSWAHFSSSKPFWFSNSVQINGNLLPYIDGTQLTGTKTLGDSTHRWKSLYVGTANSYGSATVPVYWDNGVPTAITSYSGNAATATKLQTARTISLTGSVTGSGTFDGSGNLSIATTTNHNHDSNYVKKSGDTMSGTLGVPQLYINNPDWENDTFLRFREGGSDAYGAFIAYGSGDSFKIGTRDGGTDYRAISISRGSTSVTVSGNLSASKVYGAVWNDYAEYRQSDVTEPGRVVIENGDGTLSLSTKRLQRGAEIISDTFGFAIGETDECKTPIAATGRVLAYTYEPIEEYKSKIGWPVCSGPNGTVSIMSEEEEEKYPSRIIGTISEVPTYEEWGTGKVKVDGRVWIRIK